jgi:AcrR family transcriptional regulator
MVRQERAVRTRGALIRAAAEVFAETGYTAASLGAVSTRAGVSAGALHFHFSSKGALAEAVALEATAGVRNLTGLASALSGDALQQLVDSAYLLTERLRADPVLRAGLGFGTTAQAPAGDVPRGEWRHWVAGQLRLAERAGRLGPQVWVEDAASVVVAATLDCAPAPMRRPAPGYTPRSAHHVTRVWRLLLPGLVSGSERSATLRLEPPPLPARWEG